jgi:F-type H+-transporting ATPase subunit epsilon
VNLEIITRRQVIYSGKVDTLVLPAMQGEMGVLAGHADFIVMLRKGDVRLSGGGESRTITIDGGFAEVSRDRVTVLPDSVSTTAVAPGESSR